MSLHDDDVDGFGSEWATLYPKSGNLIPDFEASGDDGFIGAYSADVLPAVATVEIRSGMAYRRYLIRLLLDHVGDIPHDLLGIDDLDKKWYKITYVKADDSDFA